MVQGEHMILGGVFSSHIKAGKSRQQDLDAGGDTTSTIRKQRGCMMLSFFSLWCSVSSQGMVPPTMGRPYYLY